MIALALFRRVISRSTVASWPRGVAGAMPYVNPRQSHLTTVQPQADVAGAGGRGGRRATEPGAWRRRADRRSAPRYRKAGLHFLDVLLEAAGRMDSGIA